jgi:hypothetical protein
MLGVGDLGERRPRTSELDLGGIDSVPCLRKMYEGLEGEGGSVVVG